MSDLEGLTELVNRRLSWASAHWFPTRTRGGIKEPVIDADIAPQIAAAVLSSTWMAERDAAAEARGAAALIEHLRTKDAQWRIANSLPLGYGPRDSHDNVFDTAAALVDVIAELAAESKS